jgi:hypothetical protein
MWWPAIGGVVIGIGGLVFPPALGVGYDVIGRILQGDTPRNLILGVLIVKSAIWVFSLGSGTSGGVLAPLLMIGGAAGGIEAMFLPDQGAGFWPLISMAAVLGGTLGSPLTAVVFALELTRDVNVLLPLLIAAMLAHAFTSLTMKRSILTEKIARRGYHVTREYVVDPLEVLFVREVMREVTRDDAVRVPGLVARPDEPLRAVVYRMAESGQTVMSVVKRGEVVGRIELKDMLKARVRDLDEERTRKRVIRFGLRGSNPRNALQSQP